jgi:starvation-inducible DNA-binding protein
MSPELKSSICEYLNKILSSLVDLRSCCEVAHFNVKGMNFYQFHLMFGEFVSALSSDIDFVGETIVFLDGYADTYCGTAINNSVCHDIPNGLTNPNQILTNLLECYLELHEFVIKTVEYLLEEDVQGVADRMLGVQANLEKSVYFLKSSLG